MVTPRSQGKTAIKLVNVKKILSDQKKWENRVKGQGKRSSDEEE